MNPDFVYKKVLNGCLNANVSQTEARNAAVYALDCYKKGKYKGKVLDLITDSIKQAKKVGKKGKAA